MREMRRKDCAIPQAEARAILENGIYGVLATAGEDGWPYATPLSYVVHGEDIYFHCARDGQKIDNMNWEQRVCFCTVAGARAVFDKDLTSYFESVVVYGRASEVTDPARKREALMWLTEKYLPAYHEEAEKEITESINITAIYKINIEKMTGKAKRPKA